MRLSAPAAGLFLFAIFFVFNSPHAQASPAKQIEKVNLANSVLAADISDPLNHPLAKPAEPAALPKAVEHVVADGETLSKIAELYSTTWLRLYSKNPDIENPDIIAVGSKVIIPLPDEVLPERTLPALPPVASASIQPAGTRVRTAAAVFQTAYRGSSSGNSYAPGYCTWYAKQRRPDLPNNLGNANTWVSRAAAQGIPTGSAPHSGAIGQQGMHVVYVEAVNSDGTIRVSEMNYAGFGVVSSRIAYASSFLYIY